MPSLTTLAVLFQNAAALFRNEGLYEEAEPLLKRALEIQERGFGPEHWIRLLCLTVVAVTIVACEDRKEDILKKSENAKTRQQLRAVITATFAVTVDEVQRFVKRGASRYAERASIRETSNFC